MEDQLYSGQGYLTFEEELADKTYGPIKDLGSITSASFATTIEDVKHREKRSGNRAVDGVLKKATDCTATFVVENFSMDALGLHFGSNVETIAPGDVVDFPVGYATVPVAEPNAKVTPIGGALRVPFLNVEDLVFTDSSPTPVELELGTHYAIVSAAHGYYKLLSTTGLIGKLKASCSHGGRKSIKAMSKSKVTGRLSFIGVNSARDNEPRLVQAVATLNTADSFSLIDEDYGQYTVTAECLSRNGSLFTVDGVPGV